jgi:hypothetical protein
MSNESVFGEQNWLGVLMRGPSGWGLAAVHSGG